jgi:hypothetical protein
MKFILFSLKSVIEQRSTVARVAMHFRAYKRKAELTQLKEQIES